MDCDALRMERTRLLAQRDDLNKPQLSMTDAEREAELTRMNGKRACSKWNDGRAADSMVQGD